MDSLFVECARLVRVIGDATKREDVLLRLGEDPKRGHDEHELLRLEDCSEYPVVIDLTRRMTYLKDDYPHGHPGHDSQAVASVEDYRHACSSYMIWPPERPITFGVLMQVADELSVDAPNGSSVAESRNSFIENELPRMVTMLVEDAG